MVVRTSLSEDDGSAKTYTSSRSDEDAPERVAAWIRGIAPEGTAVAADRIGPVSMLDPADEEFIADAVARRRNEFSTGRRLAREALAVLDCASARLRPDADRVPSWPADFVGTISHSATLCVTLVGRASNLIGVGVDIEEIKQIQSKLRPLICRGDEVDTSDTGGAVDPTLLRFVAKEAFYKAYFPTTRWFLDFQDVRVLMDFTKNRFEAQLANPSVPSLAGARSFAGRIAPVGIYVVAAVWIAR